jgi:hypothetical protein
MENKPGNPISFSTVFRAFLIFITLQFFVAPGLFLIWYWWSHGVTLSPTKVEDPLITGWVNVLGMVITALGLYIYLQKLQPACTQAVWSRLNKPTNVWYKDFLFGASTIILAYPFVIAIEVVTSLVLSYLGINIQHDQVAVKQVRGVLGEFPLLILLSTCICIFVPFVEELLFRGFLQQWLKKFFSLSTSIFFTSMMFASIHYSSDQGISNVPLIISLFILSCFLGFVREYRGSVWASMGLHSLFNAISIALLAATS